MRWFCRNPDRVGIRRFEAELGAAEIFAAGLTAELLVLVALDGELDIFGGERLAIVPFDIRAQLELPGVVVNLRPFRRQAGLEAAIDVVEFHQHLVDVFRNDPADVLAGSHTGLDDIDGFGKHNSDVALGILRLSRAEAQREHRC